MTPSAHCRSAAVLPTSPVSEDNRRNVKTFVMAAQHLCAKIELDAAHQRLLRLDLRLLDPAKFGGLTYHELINEIEVIRQTIQDQLDKRTFTYVPQLKAPHFEPATPLGMHGSVNFPRANKEAIEAATCYAVGRNTASVFHSMRVLEHGLRALGVDLNVQFPHPIELQQWQNIIEKIEADIRALEQQLPKGMLKSERLQFYGQAASQFWYFKEAWRNHVAHSRESYDEGAAFKIITHVQDFMEYLAIGGLHE
jgi:hypothetical protein